MAFFHIALPEMKEALLPYLDENGLGEVPEHLGFGAIREGIACPPLNSGLFDAMKELGSTKNIFSATTTQMTPPLYMKAFA